MLANYSFSQWHGVHASHLIYASMCKDFRLFW